MGESVPPKEIAEKVNILLVDDQPENLLALEAVLGDLGQNLVKAHSGKEALREVLARKFALILLDVQMPEMDGYETAALIREHPARHHVPIIFLTAVYKADAHLMQGYDAGAVDYLLKPLDPTILKSKVAVFIKLAQQSALLLKQTAALVQRDAQAHEFAKMREVLAEVSQKNLDIRTLNRKLEAMIGQVREDPLTKTLNRHGLAMTWDIEVARSERQKSPLCLAMLDLDDFKRLNDRLGHQAGDRALVHLANVLRQTLRPSDIIARYGGEEFVVLLPHTPADEAVRVVLRLQHALTNQSLMHDQERIQITFSAGVAERQAKESREDLLKRADTALYEAKRRGKNRVLAAG
ncbi:MAG: diguanylate cyclase [Betaproteobacteria bacterium]|nr:diguanylate cyclase [Betaproteobacteria bacterium]